MNYTGQLDTKVGRWGERARGRKEKKMKEQTKEGRKDLNVYLTPYKKVNLRHLGGSVG